MSWSTAVYSHVTLILKQRRFYKVEHKLREERVHFVVGGTPASKQQAFIFDAMPLLLQCSSFMFSNQITVCFNTKMKRDTRVAVFRHIRRIDVCRRHTRSVTKPFKRALKWTLRWPENQLHARKRTCLACLSDIIQQKRMCIQIGHVDMLKQGLVEILPNFC